MCHWNKIYSDTYLFDLGPRFFGQNGIDITWNNDKNVKLVKQLLAGIRSFYENNTILLFHPLVVDHMVDFNTHTQKRFCNITVVLVVV